MSESTRHLDILRRANVTLDGELVAEMAIVRTGAVLTFIRLAGKMEGR